MELEIEKELGLHSKHEIEAYGIAEFNQRCRESVRRYVEDWAALTSRSGTWIDTKDAYWTLSNDYIESVWWLVRQMWDAGLIYEGHRVVPYCARCGTALSSHEVAQGYRDVVDPSVYVRFPITDGPAGDGGRSPRLDHHALDARVERGAAVGPEITYLRVLDPRRRRRPGHGLGGPRSAATPRPRWSPRSPDPELAGARYQRPIEVLPIDETRPAGGGGRIREHRRRLGDRPHRTSLR